MLPSLGFAGCPIGSDGLAQAGDFVFGGIGRSGGVRHGDVWGFKVDQGAGRY